MNESSTEWLATARDMEAAVLQRLRDDTTQAEIAKALGMHKSTVSRLVNEHGPALIRMQAYLGFQLADRSALLLPKEDLDALVRFAAKGLTNLITPGKEKA